MTNLGGDRIILGYPWLHNINPVIDWPNCKLIGPRVKIETPFFTWSPNLRTLLAKKGRIVPTQNKPNQIGLVVRSGELPESPAIPERYKDYADIFSKEKAKQLPPH